MKKVFFEWDDKKDLINRKKHGVSFYDAQKAFLDAQRVIAEDLELFRKRLLHPIVSSLRPRAKRSGKQSRWPCIVHRWSGLLRRCAPRNDALILVSY